VKRSPKASYEECAQPRQLQEVSIGRNASRLEGRFAELFELFGQRARALALTLTGDPELAQDIAQEAFVRLFASFRNLRGPDAAWPYLRKTIINLARSHFRKRALERSYLGRHRPFLPEQQAYPFDDELLGALHSLPYRQRVAVVLRFCEDLSEQATAEVLGVSAKAVNGLVNRALTALRERVTENGK
jgi:RNA polymerase sigma factor (sigma-70 family)